MNKLEKYVSRLYSIYFRYDNVLPWDDDVDLAMDYKDIANVNDSLMALVVIL